MIRHIQCVQKETEQCSLFGDMATEQEYSFKELIKVNIVIFIYLFF